MIVLEACTGVWGALPADRRRHALGLGLLLTVTVLGELAAIVSWYPFTRALLEPDTILATPWIAKSYQFLGFASIRSFQMFLGAFVLFALLVSSGLGILASWCTTRFGWTEKGRLGELLLTRLVRSPRTELLRRNSTEMARDVLMNVGLVVDGYFLALARTYTALLFVGATLTTFLMVHPWMALASGIATGLIYTGIYAGVQTRIRGVAQLSYGEAYHVTRTANEALSLVKEARCPPHRIELSAAFGHHLTRLNEALFRQTLLEEVPGPLALATAQIGILLGGIYIVMAEGDQSRALLAVFAVALAKLIPEAKAIYRGLLQLRHIRPIATELLPLLASAEQAAATGGSVKAPVLTKSIRVENITFRYSPEGPDVLRAVTLDLAVGSSLALIGKTGCGKTTIADLVAGVLLPCEGRVLIDEQELTADQCDSWRSSIGYVPQDVYMTQDSLRRNIAFGVDEDEIDEEAVRRSASTAKIHDFIESLPEGYETIVGERGLAISGGQRQRVGIARALYRNPRVLILDEATSALDSVTEASIMDALEDVAQDRTVLVIAHRLSSVRSCTEICLLEDGAVLAVGPFETLLAECPEFRDLVEASKEGAAS